MRILRNKTGTAIFDKSLLELPHLELAVPPNAPPDAIVMRVHARVKLKRIRKPLEFVVMVLLKTEGKHWEEK
jgi:hypothetical protein